MWMFIEPRLVSTSARKSISLQLTSVARFWSVAGLMISDPSFIGLILTSKRSFLTLVLIPLKFPMGRMVRESL